MCLPGTIETVRARVEQEGLPRLDRRAALLGAADRGHTVLYSTRILKKTGLRLGA